MKHVELQTDGHDTHCAFVSYICRINIFHNSCPFHETGFTEITTKITSKETNLVCACSHLLASASQFMRAQ
jgi:hypothetical protein